MRLEKKLSGIISVMMVLALITTGCSSEQTIETDEGEVVVDEQEQSVEYTSEDETVKAEIQLEGGAQVPEGYPEELFPLYPGSSVVMGQVVQDGSFKSYSVSLKQADDVEAVYAYYLELVQKAESLMDLKTQNTHNLAGSINGFDFGIVIAPNAMGGEEQTMVQISLAEKE